MALAVFLSGLTLITAIYMLRRRSVRASFICLKSGAKIRDCIIKLPRVDGCLRQGFEVFEKLDSEIRLFNAMRVVMRCRGRVPVMYLDCFSNLVVDCRSLQTGGDGYAKLMYLYASANLFRLTSDGLVRKQLLKNCLWVFGRSAVKRRVKGTLLASRRFYVFRQRRFKLLGTEFIENTDFEIIGQTLKRRDSESYVTYYNQDIVIKRYADKILRIGCFEVTASQGCTFALDIGADKMRYSLSHTSDTFFCVDGKSAVGVFTFGKAEFGSSICEKGERLKVYIGVESENKIFAIEGGSKAEIVRVVQQLKQRGGKVDYLCDAGEAAVVREVEGLFEKAYLSRYVEGEELKEKFAVAMKYVPTLFLPTLVYEITEQADFFEVVDLFWAFKRIAAAGRNLNVVFLYSDLNDAVREIINAFADKGEARELIKAGVFLFFINRVTANSKAVNYLSLMAQIQIQHLGRASVGAWDCGAVSANNKNIEVNRHISVNFPVTHSVFVRNTIAKAQNAKVSVDIEVGNEYPACVVKKGAGICVTGLKPGSRNYNIKLPVGARVKSDTGKVIANSEVACDRIFVECDVKLLPNEEKVLKIIKNEGGLGRREKKDAFIGSLDGLAVKSGDKRLEQIFKAEIIDGGNEKLLGAVKAAVRGVDREMFFGLFYKREKMPADVWAFLIEKVIGLRLLKGRVQLMPCVQITGDFELSFSYADTPYNFAVKQKGGGFSVRYGENEYRNFLQVAVD